MIRNQRKKNFKETGITLVALVVTIIVLLILAGVTLFFVLGENGVITRAGNARYMQAKATVEQEIEQGRGYAETYKQTWSGNYLEKLKEFLENDQTLESVSSNRTATVENRNGAFLVLGVGEELNYKLTETETIFLGNSEEAEDALRPEVVDLISSNVEFSYSKTTSTKEPVTVTITVNQDLGGNTLRYKLGEEGTYQNYTAPFSVSDNCIIYTALYNGKEYGAYATGEVSNIDTTAPTSCTFTIGEVTADSITVTATASDATGIKYFDFSSDGGTTYPAANRQTIATPSAGSTSKNFTFENLDESTEYTLRVKAIDEAGNTLESESQTKETNSGILAISSLSSISDLSDMYGKITDFKSLDGIDWQLFYHDSEYYYLITTETIPEEYAPDGLYCRQ